MFIVHVAVFNVQVDVFDAKVCVFIVHVAVFNF